MGWVLFYLFGVLVALGYFWASASTDRAKDFTSGWYVWGSIFWASLWPVVICLCLGAVVSGVLNGLADGPGDE